MESENRHKKFLKITCQNEEPERYKKKILTNNFKYFQNKGPITILNCHQSLEKIITDIMRKNKFVCAPHERQKMICK